MPSGPCDVCAKTQDTRVCARCRSRTYCGRACQLKDWKEQGHNRLCKTLQAAKERQLGRQLPESRKVPQGRVPKEGRRMRTLMAGLLAQSAGPKHTAYVPFAMALSGAVAEIHYEDVVAHMQWLEAENGFTKRMARVALGYQEGELNLCALEMADNLFTTAESLQTPGRDARAFLVSPTSKGIQDKLDGVVHDIGSNCPEMRIVRLPYALSVSTKSLLSLAKGCPHLKWLELFGASQPDCVDDSVLTALADNCSELENLSFGMDNKYLPPLDVSPGALARLARQCPNLRFLRIGQVCKGGNDPTDANGEIARALAKEGMTLRTLPSSEGLRGSLLTDDTQYWRHEVEYKMISAGWYEREKRNDNDHGSKAAAKQ